MFFYSKNDFLYVVPFYIIMNILCYFLINFKKSSVEIFKIKISKKTDQFYGNLSYPIYLNHYAILVLFISLLNKYIIDSSLQVRILYFLLFNIIVFVISFYLIKFSDFYTDSIRNKIRGVKFNSN